MLEGILNWGVFKGENNNFPKYCTKILVLSYRLMIRLKNKFSLRLYC